MHYLKLKSIILILFAFLLYSTTAVFSKFASKHDLFSFHYLLFFSFLVIGLGIYAILWQIILKKTPLNIAFMFKSSTIIFGLLFSYFLFEENVTLPNIIGGIIIIIGMLTYSTKE